MNRLKLMTLEPKSPVHFRKRNMKTQITKNFHLDEPIAKVWESLSNPEEIVTCVPGAAITEKVDEANYKGEVTTKFGPVKAKYAGDIEIVELDEANRTMRLKGRGLDSKGKGSADMVMVGKLQEANGGTDVSFQMDIAIVGMLAQFGSRLINDVSDQLLNQFVDNFKSKLANVAFDNSLDTGAVTGTVAKSFMQMIMDFFGNLFGGKKAA